MKLFSLTLTVFLLCPASFLMAETAQGPSSDLLTPVISQEMADQQTSAGHFRYKLSNLSKEKKAVALNLAGAAAVIGYGVFFWNYSLENDYNIESEGWFEADSNHGGVDKCGHFYVGYLMGDFFGHFYDKWGFGREKSALLSFLSSVGFTSVMEIGDGFSEYGSSPEDMVANITGAAASYLLRKYPALSKKVDLRLEYRPSCNSDISTDYANMKFLLALKADGFEAIENDFFKYLELHIGYYATGFEEEEAHRERNIYVGLGFNLSRLVRKKSKPLSTFFTYYQMPYIYLPVEKSFKSDH